MATQARITDEQYLHMTFEYDAEFVHGELVERAMPDDPHSLVQFLIMAELARLVKSFPLFPRPERRLKLAPDVYRIPDISVFAERPPGPNVAPAPPLLIIEILSRDDRYYHLMEKLEEYRVWGVANIWVVDPHLKRLLLYTGSDLHSVSSLQLTDYPFELTPAALFSDL